MRPSSFHSYTSKIPALAEKSVSPQRDVLSLPVILWRLFYNLFSRQKSAKSDSRVSLFSLLKLLLKEWLRLSFPQTASRPVYNPPPRKIPKITRSKQSRMWSFAHPFLTYARFKTKTIFHSFTRSSSMLIMNLMAGPSAFWTTGSTRIPGSGSLRETVVSKRSLFANDPIRPLLLYYCFLEADL